MNDLISIIIPVYNREMYIEECVRSIQAQTFTNYEIILVDDGSADNTLAICRDLAREDPAIRIFEGAHAGVSAARNMGLDAARGDYVFFIDSDDVIHPRLLESLAAGLTDSDAAIAGTDVRCVPEEKWSWVQQALQKDTGLGKTIYHSHQDAVHAMFHLDSPLSGIGGIMMRKDLIGETRFRTDLFLGEDAYFIYQNLIKGASAVFLKPLWYYARFHESNSTFNYSFQGFWSRFYQYKLIWESEEQLGRAENANRRKLAAFGWYLTCVKNNPPGSEDSKKIRQTLKEHRKTILPCLTAKGTLRYYLSVYMPSVYLKIAKDRA